ncbi:PEP/pyruvate-binding domain-containing protein [Nocardia sp. N2S4-5]|uniref:PEP/pyruvate-binding domain-containing protein n=1 Tax=Nocardia sp. N2S4-5 TaxID=3351565 RepID=UPI0037D93413
MNSSVPQDDSYTLPLADPAATLDRAGGKGSSLARMAAARLPVPPGFHVTTTAYRRFVAAAGLHDRILAVAARVAADQPETWAEAAAEIAELIAAQEFPDEVAEEIGAAYKHLGEVAVAVRSSATAEDLPEMSFAGQQETYLNIHGADAVLAAVRRCWASLWTDRAIGYRARNDIDSGEVALAVVVQELVPADAAGIAFTADPLTGARDEVLINAAWGLGEAVVGGQVTPDTFVVAKASGAIVREEIADKQIMTIRTPDGTREEPVPADRRERPALRPEQAAELARIAVRIETFYGQPMDIEWVLHEQRLFVVQARPITALPEAPGDAQWELPDPKGKYTRGSVMELLPEPLSPLFATLAIPAWERATLAHYREIALPYFDRPLAVINGYGYYNVNYTPALLARMMVAQPRFLARTLPRYLRTAPERWQAARRRYRDTAARLTALDRTAVPAARLLDGVREIVAEAADYYLVIQGGALPAAYLSESLFTKVYNTIKRADDPPATTFLLGFDSKPILAEQALYDLAQWVRTQPGLADRIEGWSAESLTHAPDEGTGDAAEAEFRERFRAHLETYGDMVYDLDFAKPLPADDPAALIQTLRYFLRDEAADPAARRSAAGRRRAEAVGTLEARRPGPRHALALRLLHWAQAAAPLRENALADVGAGWPAARRLLSELGRRLTAAGAVTTVDDVYWLEAAELEAAVAALDATAAPQDSRSAVAERRAVWRRQRTQRPPVALPVQGGNRILGIEFTRDHAPEGDADSGDTIKGTPGSPGKVTAPARIIHGPSEFDRMRPGDVLVAPMTTPAWTPLFALASAIVTDVGGALSHSSIVAREYHIPAVLGTGTATERLQTGRLIVVDGDTGVITVPES